MRRSMAPDREREFEELLAFLDFHHERFRKQPSTSPLQLTLRAIVEGIANEYGRSKALQGTKQAVNDVLEELSQLTRTT